MELSSKKKEKKKEKKDYPPSDKLYIFPNPDKVEPYRLGKDEWMPFNSSRILFSGPPASGKRSVILNIVFRLEPKPSSIHIIHIDPDTIEYDILNDLNVPIYYYGPDDFITSKNISDPNGDDYEEEEEQKNSDEEMEENPLALNPLVIIDEITSDMLSPLGRSRFERLTGFIATHQNTLVLCSIQSLLNIPVKARRNFNIFVIWKQMDNTLNKLVAQKTSMKLSELEDMFKLLHSKHDFLYIDSSLHPDDPLRCRLNMIYPIHKETQIGAVIL